MNDANLPADIRAVGALILLYGLQTVDLLTLRREQVVERAGDHYLAINDGALILPPALAALLIQLPLSRNNNRTVLQGPCSASPLLFPGFSDSRPLDRAGFGARLLSHGIAPRECRNTARLALAADLPASVLADLLGIHNVTATRWAHRTKRDWRTYLAHRRTELGNV